MHSVDVGWTDIDLRITEVENTGAVALFHVPGHAGRTAMEARFAHCVYSRFALLGGYTHWRSMVKADRPDHVEVRFSDGADGELGGDEKSYSASLLAVMCGFFDPRSGKALH